MFCPRCGRPVSDTANFCGGCGLPRAEIEKNNLTVPQAAPVDINELNKTISQLENELAEDTVVIDYTTHNSKDTNNTENTAPSSDFIQQEILQEQKKAAEMKEAAVWEQAGSSRQSAYSYNAPQAPVTNAWESVKSEVSQPEEDENDQNLSTVDFIWMMLLSAVPVVGLFYMIYLGFVQEDNVNKKSFARAALIISIFSFTLSIVFMMGIMLSRFVVF